MKTTRWLPILTCLPLVAARGHDILFTSGRSALCIPFDATNRHIGFQARLNDRDGLRLVLDTGAGGSVLDAGARRLAGPRSDGTATRDGLGRRRDGIDRPRRRRASPRDRASSIRRWARCRFRRSRRSPGSRMDGILGYPLLSRMVVEVDYPNKCVSLFDPDGLQVQRLRRVAAADVQAEPPVRQGSRRSARRPFDLRQVLVDTGASTSVILSPEAVEREGVKSAVWERR